MVDIVLLDSGPLGMVSHPRPTMEITTWLGQLLAVGVEVMIPEIADYEIRRELLRSGRTRGVRRLDKLKSLLTYVPITTAAMIRAAEFWAEARRRGYPTAHDASLDADVILAGQAATFPSKSVIIASANPKHLDRYVEADHWQQITP